MNRRFPVRLALTVAGALTSIRLLSPAGSAAFAQSEEGIGTPLDSAASTLEASSRSFPESLQRPLLFPSGRARFVTARAPEDRKSDVTPPAEDRGTTPEIPRVETRGAGLRIFGIPLERGVALSWTRGGATEPRLEAVRLFRWKRGETPRPLLEDGLTGSAHLDEGALPGFTYWYALEASGDGGLARIAVTRVHVRETARFEVVGGTEASGAWIRILRSGSDGGTTPAARVKQGERLLDPVRKTGTAWTLRQLREIREARPVEVLEPVFLADGRVALAVSGTAPLRSPRRRWRDEAALEVVLQSEGGETRTLRGPVGDPGGGKG